MPKISDNRIVCPANAWRYFTGERTNSGCTRIACCYGCSKESCIGGAGCSPSSLKRDDDPKFPEECRSYPLTFGEAKRIFTFVALFERKWIEHPAMKYIYFQKAVEVYISDKKEKK